MPQHIKKTLYTCYKCDDKFDEVCTLRMHVKSHPMESNEVCKDIPLFSQLANHADSGELQCTKNTVADAQMSVKDFMAKVEKQMPYKCD